MTLSFHPCTVTDYSLDILICVNLCGFAIERSRQWITWIMCDEIEKGFMRNLTL